jgi:hypothetical protein
MSDLERSAAEEIHAAIDEIERLTDELVLTKARLKVAKLQLSLLERRYPDEAGPVKAARGLVEEEGDAEAEAEAAPKRRGRKPAAES